MDARQGQASPTGTGQPVKDGPAYARQGRADREDAQGRSTGTGQPVRDGPAYARLDGLAASLI